MFDLGILDIGIGLALVFLLVSLICSAIREAIESVMKTRAGDLERGIRELLVDPEGTGLTERLFNHPLICGLFGAESYDPSKLKTTMGMAGQGEGMKMPRSVRMSLPSYIPANQFSSALIDLIAQGPPDSPYPKPPLSVESLRAAASAIDSEPVKRAILSAIDHAEGDLAKAKANIETWFNGTMDRITGWYKRRTQWVLFAIGIVAAVALNVDAITIAKRLGSDEALRDAIVAKAGATVAAGIPDVKAPAADTSAPAPASDATAETTPRTTETPPATPAIGTITPDTSIDEIRKWKNELESIGLPIGWSPFPQAAMFTLCKPPTLVEGCVSGKWSWLLGGFLVLIGWLITAFAVMLGAPFWFDILSKFMTVRSTLKPKDKAPDQGVEERQGGTQPGAAVSAKSAPPGSTVAAPPPAGYTANEWNTTDPKAATEGIL